jgi:membrane protein
VLLRSVAERVAALPSARRVWRALKLIAGGFRGEAITLRASALTYLTLLSLVPLLAVIYSVVDLVSGHAPFHDAVQKYVNEQLGIGAGAAVAGALTQFTNKATMQTLGLIGFALLLFSALSLLWNIESAFNHIYAVKRPRSPVQRLLKYWAFLTIGPVFLTASVAVTWQITAIQAGHGHKGHSEIVHVLAALSSVLITYAALSFLYKVLPNARVRFRSALSAGLVAGTAWELAKFVFAEVSSHLVQVHRIYGPVAVLPIVLTWVYISWFICLTGCRLCYALDASRRPEPHPLLLAAEAREVFVARVLVAAALLQRQAISPASVARLAREVEAPRRLVREALRALEQGGLCVEARQGGFVLARDATGITLADLRAAGRKSVPFPRQEPDAAGEALVRAFAQADGVAQGALSETLDEFLQRFPRVSALRLQSPPEAQPPPLRPSRAIKPQA